MFSKSSPFYTQVRNLRVAVALTPVSMLLTNSACIDTTMMHRDMSEI